jgi:hypothetical protein
VSFVPESFEPPLQLVTPGFELEPLGPQHNDRDYAAWTSSMEHIRATPGFRQGDWPHPMTPEENRADLERHAADFRARTGFTYTVLAGEDVVGCVYIYPSKDGSGGAKVLSWVTATHAELDAPLRAAVRAWLAERWPFERVLYEG